MNRALTSALALALLALPLAAGEEKKTTTTTAAAAQPAPEDSPLVAAAKRMNRLGRKPASKIMITNETLKQSGGAGHITTSEQQPAINMPAPAPEPTPTPEMAIAKKKAAEQKRAAQIAAAKQQAEEQKLLRMAAASEAAEEEYPDDVDPAQAEKALRDAHEAQKEQKPPRD